MTSRSSETRRWSDSLAAGLLGGAAGGLLFLAAGLARDGADFVAYWPSAGFALWLIVRSVAVYALVFGVAGMVLAAVLHPFLGRFRPAIFALVTAATVAVTVLAYLTAWWQIEVLAGLPIDDPGRWRGALAHGLIAVAAGAAVAVLLLLAHRRLMARRPEPWTLIRPATITLAGALVALVVAEVGLGSSAPRMDSAADGPAAAARPPAARPPAARPPAARPSQVVVVGLDGLTLRVLSPLLRAGELPAFRRLMAEGAWGTFLTYGTASSPQVWTSMATGKRVRDHGVDDFVKAHGAGYRTAVMKSSDRKVPAIWNLLGDFGRRVAVVDWLVTFPPEEVNGYMVSRLKIDAKGQTHPPELYAELAGSWNPRPEDDPRLSPFEEDRRQLLWNVDRVFDAARHLLGKEQLAGNRLDFLAVYDASADRVEHESWKYYQAAKFDSGLWQIDPETAAERAALIPDVYRHLDRRLGELLERLAGDALVLVVSDHGQRAAASPRVSLRLDRVLAALGYSRLLPGSGPRDGVDYAASRAFTLAETPWKPVLRVKLNLRGREPRGIVDPGEAPALARRLAADLRGVRFDDGTPLFAGVTLTGSLRRGPKAGGGADLRVALSRHARGLGRSSQPLAIGETARPLAHYQRVNTTISGAHDHQGVIFARGPGIEPGYVGQRLAPTAAHDLLWHLTDKVGAVDSLLPLLRRLGWIGRASTLDLTPTMLYALGLPVARDMAGRPLKALFSDPLEVEWVASYDTLGERLAAGEEPPPDRPPSGDTSDEEVLKRLRALGYVE